MSTPSARLRPKRKTVVRILLLTILPIATGFLSTLATPRLGALVARALLDTLDRAAALLVLIAAGLPSLVLGALAQEHRNTNWERVWKHVKLGWKVYALTLLSFILFAVGAFIAVRMIR